MSLEAFADYLTLERNYSQHTAVAYLRDLAQFQEFVLATYDSDNITTVGYPVIRSWIVELVESGTSIRSVNRKMSSLKSYYRFLQKIEMIRIHPMAQHVALRRGESVQLPFSESEIAAVIQGFSSADTFEEVRDLAIIELLYATGIRRAELISIKLEDLLFDQHVLKVLGKRNKERLVPLLPDTIHRLSRYISVREQLPKIVDSDFLFLTKKGKKIYGTLVYRVINNYFSRVSGKAKKSPHILRHSFATHLLNNGANINAVKDLLGHESLASTQVYAKNNIETLKEVYRKSHPKQ